MTRHKHSCGHVHDCEAPYPTAAACPVTGGAAMELLALCDRLDQAREAWLPRRYAYPSHPTFEQDAGDVQAVWSDGARTTWVECEDEDDAALIVAAVNAVPELTAAVRRLLADRQAVERVRTYVDHPGLPDATCRKLIRRALGGAS